MTSLFTKLILLPMIYLLPFIALASSSVIYTWILMEISTMAFIFLMLLTSIDSKGPETSMTYFLIQSLASSLLLPILLLCEVKFPFVSLDLFINLILMLKLGLFPFHIWVPWMMNNLSWNNCFILTTMQKIIPLLFLSSFMSIEILIILCMLTIFISGIMILKSSPLKKIMAYSSISNSGWLILLLTFDLHLTILYIILYTLNSFILFKIFQKYNIINLSDFNKLGTPLRLPMKLSIVLMFISMAGLPPFVGFFLKFVTILAFKLSTFYLVLIIIISLLNLYGYLIIAWNFLFKAHPTSKSWNNSKMPGLTKIEMLLMFSLISFWILCPFLML